MIYTRLVFKPSSNGVVSQKMLGADRTLLVVNIQGSTYYIIDVLSGCVVDVGVEERNKNRLRIIKKKLKQMGVKFYAELRRTKTKSS